MEEKVEKCKKDIKILIISSCTKTKASEPNQPPKLVKRDFKELIETIVSTPNESWHNRIPDWLQDSFLKPAIERYLGQQHTNAVEGLNTFRKKGISADFNIISAGYGLIKEKDKIADYTVTFSSTDDFPTTEHIIDWSRRLKIRVKAVEAISGYDIVFFLLGDEYLKALNFEASFSDEELESLTGKKLVFFIPTKGLKTKKGKITKKAKENIGALMTGKTFACFVNSSAFNGINGLGGEIPRKGCMLKSFANNVELSHLEKIRDCTEPQEVEKIITKLILHSK